MTKVRVGRRDAATVGRLLEEISQGPGLSADLQHKVGWCAAAVDRTMDRSDLEHVAVLLRQASTERGLSNTHRNAARYWAAYLEGRVW
jgi:hypothetical protein